MKFAIVGAGAMGSYFGARLALAGHDVTLVDIDVDHVSAIRRSGLVFDDGGANHVVGIEAHTTAEAITQPEVIVFLTKANTLRAALETATGMTRAAQQVVVLANGLGTGAVAADYVPSSRLVHGCTSAGAVLEGPGRVRFTVPGETYIGAFDDSSGTERVDDLASLLTAAGLPTVATDQVVRWIWTKLLINVAYNAGTALTRVRNGEFVEHVDGSRVLEHAVLETVAVAAASGIHLHVDDPVAFVTEVGRMKIAANQSSMLLDVLQGRGTEIDFLNGAVAEEGRRVGIPTPVNETLAALVRVLQSGFSGADIRELI